MSKLGCTCGHIISDITDFLPYKGGILKDENSEIFWDSITTELASFFESAVSEKRQEWIVEHFGPLYPKDVNNESIVFGILSGMWINMLSVYECESCGRLWIQSSTQSNHYISYSPDDGKRHRVLAADHSKKSKSGRS